MEYKCILERNCEDATRHLSDARKTGETDRIAAAHQTLKRYLDIAKNMSPDVFAKYAQYL